jgi:hypothetical protein
MLRRNVAITLLHFLGVSSLNLGRAKARPLFLRLMCDAQKPVGRVAHQVTRQALSSIRHAVASEFAVSLPTVIRDSNVRHCLPWVSEN